MKHYHGTRIYCDSVGVRSAEIDPLAIEAMRELGLDLARHKNKTFDELWDSSFDLVITLSPEAHHRAIEMTRTMACDVEYWPTFDATVVEGSREARLAAFRQVRDELAKRIREKFPFSAPTMD